MLSGKLIREARKRAGLTQAELAARLGASQSEISRWERGAVVPSFETLREAVRACGLELTVGIANGDDSYAAHHARTRALTPAERIAQATAHGRSVLRLRDAARAARGG